MIFLYLILLGVVLSSVRFLKTENNGIRNYMSKNNTENIKGICIWLVFLRHIGSYMVDLPTLNASDEYFFLFDEYVRQLLVVPFLFYSGYGVTIAILKKGEQYSNAIPTKRFVPTLINFDIAVVIFLCMNFVLDNKLDLTQIVLAFTGWESIGNSNWYIFCILICYLFSWVSVKIFGISNKMILGVWVGIIVYTATMYFFKGHWWYDTIYAYGFGVLYAYYKENLEPVIRVHYYKLLVFSLIAFVVFYNMQNYFSIPANIVAVILCILLILITFKIKLNSTILLWSGQHLFPLYIYQRLPMVIFSSILGGAFIIEHRYLYVFICLVCTVVIAFAYKGYNFYSSFVSRAICLKKA